MGQGLPGSTAGDTIKISQMTIFCLSYVCSVLEGKKNVILLSSLTLTVGRAKRERSLT